jgi:hypothetical protein
METLANLECFIKSAELGSFSQAARRLALTPAAVSRNVSVLERNLGLRLSTPGEGKSTRDRCHALVGQYRKTASGRPPPSSISASGSGCCGAASFAAYRTGATLPAKTQEADRAAWRWAANCSVDCRKA